MHEVYGNAKFTLVAGAVEDAADALLAHRAAWLYSRAPCSLAGYALETLAPRLDEVRAGLGRVPVNTRAWTLQEERLSPRLVYWYGQMVYWSCSRVQRNELAVEQPPPPRQPSDRHMHGPQRFLKLCWHRETDRLLDEWLCVVVDYVQRGLANATDRFPGISGLAVLYYRTLTPALEGSEPQDEYLAGLWRGNFARQLTWSVERATDPTKNLTVVAPAWSWASLLLCQQMYISPPSESALAFRLQEDRTYADPMDALDAVKKGTTVREVKVQGRLRRFIGPSSRKAGWESVSWRGVDGEQYRLPDPNAPVHARNLEDGRLLAYGIHTQPLVGQLDYLIPACEGADDNVHVPAGV